MSSASHIPYNFIETYTVEHDVCDHICAFFKEHEHLAQPGRLGEVPRVNKAMKDSTDLSLPIRMYGQVDPFFELLTGFVKQYIDKYYYESGADGLGPLGFSEWSNIQRYPVGGGYPAIHCERDRIEYCHRALVWMLYLTDTPGGGTEFPHQGITTECIKGHVILWPSDMTHMHRGVVSHTHEKMIFTGWIDFITKERSQKGQS